MKNFLECYLRVEKNRACETPLVFETASFKSISALKKWFEKFCAVNTAEYSYELITHIKGERNKEYDWKELKIYSNNNGTWSWYDKQTDNQI